MYDVGTNTRGAMGGLVAVARLRTGLGVRELSRRAGVPHSQIVAIEHGRVEPTLPTVQRILRGAGLEVRLALAPYDDHDEVLAMTYEHLEPEEQRATDERHARNRAMFHSASTDRP